MRDLLGFREMRQADCAPSTEPERVGAERALAPQSDRISAAPGRRRPSPLFEAHPKRYDSTGLSAPSPVIRSPTPGFLYRLLM
jgi:hypothetical protein